MCCPILTARSVIVDVCFLSNRSVPPLTPSSVPPEVVGDQRRAVVRACNMLLMSAERGRHSLRPSHFIAARLATQHVQNRMETFKVGEVARAHELRQRRLLVWLLQTAGQLRLQLKHAWPCCKQLPARKVC